MKPVNLMRYLIRLVTPPHGILLDPFAGSGSTILSALQEGAIPLGFELDPDYTGLANNRITAFATQLPLVPNNLDP